MRTRFCRAFSMSEYTKRLSVVWFFSFLFVTTFLFDPQSLWPHIGLHFYRCTIYVSVVVNTLILHLYVCCIGQVKQKKQTVVFFREREESSILSSLESFQWSLFKGWSLLRKLSVTLLFSIENRISCEGWMPTVMGNVHLRYVITVFGVAVERLFFQVVRLNISPPPPLCLSLM